MSRLYDALQNAYSDRREKAAVPFSSAAEGRLTPGAAEDGELCRLYEAIEARLAHRPRRVIQVLACGQGEGASMVAGRLANLAVGRQGRSVMLLSNAPRPLPNSFKTRGAGGEVPVTAGLADEVGREGSVLNARALRETWNRLRTVHDLVLVEVPPVADSPLALAVAPTVDGILLVVHAGRTRVRAAQESVDALQAVGGTMLGVVFNARPDVTRR